MCHFLYLDQCPDIPFVKEAIPSISNDTTIIVNFNVTSTYLNFSLSNGTNPTLLTNAFTIVKIQTLNVLYNSPPIQIFKLPISSGI